MISQKKSNRRFRLFVVTLNMAFALFVYRVFVSRVLDVRLPGDSLVEAHFPVVIYGVMAWFGLLEVKWARKHYATLRRPVVDIMMKCYVFVYFIMALQVPYNILYKDSTLLSCMRDAIVWMLPCVAAFGLKANNWKVLRKVFAWQTVIGCVISVLSLPLARQDIASISSFIDERRIVLEAGGGILGQTEQLLYASLFLLFTINMQSLWFRFATLWSLAVVFWIGAINQFRSQIIGIAIAIGLAFGFLPLRLGRALGAKQLVRWTVFLVLFIVFVGSSESLRNWLEGSNQIGLSALGQSINVIQRRMTGTASGQNVQTDMQLRFDEMDEAISEGYDVQKIIGQGIGSVWSGGTLYNETRGMVHLGLGHLLFRGGIPLVILVAIFPFGVGLFVLTRSRDAIILACASVVSLKCLALFVANQFDLNLAHVLTMLCAGGCLMHFEAKNVHTNSLRK